MKYVNLGCGARHHPDWLNFDVEPSGPGVIRADLARGIPLADASVDVVYHSHVLEHLRPHDALTMLRECRRVLAPGGIVRIATPDLERMISTYLARLDAWRRGEGGAEHDLEWMRLELLDQVTREHSGGRMAEYLEAPPNAAFVRSRIGEEARLHEANRPRGLLARVRRVGIGVATRVAARRALTAARRALVLLIAGRNGLRAYDIGRFRLSGEVHQWLYDEQSLTALLRDAGFAGPVVRSATSSEIPDWASFHLDTLPDGTVIKPDSIYMEARRP